MPLQSLKEATFILVTDLFSIIYQSRMIEKVEKTEKIQFPSFLFAKYFRYYRWWKFVGTSE